MINRTETVSDSVLIEQLKQGNSGAYHLVYKLYFPSIAYYISQNHGNQADAEDIFQESILVLLAKLKEPEFVLSSSLKTYVYAIARNFWLKRIRDARLITTDDEAQLTSLLDAKEINFAETTPEKPAEEVVSKLLSKITVNCQYLLKAIYLYEQTMDSLMHKMGWKNKHTANNQKYKCLQQARKISEQPAE